MNKKVKKKKGISVTQEDDKAEFNEIFKFAVTEDKLPQSSISVTIKQLHTGRDEHGRQLNSTINTLNSQLSANLQRPGQSLVALLCYLSSTSN